MNSTATKTRRPDMEIAREVVTVLCNESRLELTSLEVRVHQGTVTLRGNVPTVWQRRMAAEIVRTVDGVSQVTDDLTVGLSSSHTDADIGESVRFILWRDLQLDWRTISVRTRSGIVVLSGTVATEDDKAAAEDLAWSVPGVAAIDNELKLRSSLERKPTRRHRLASGLFRDLDEAIVGDSRPRFGCGRPHSGRQ
jgi:osmotically-inducible protein OsmY